MSRRFSAVIVALAAAVVVGIVVVRADPELLDRLRYPLRYDLIVRTHAEHYRLDPALLAAVIYTESKFDPGARSEAGAMGLMQLLPETAQGIATRTGGVAFVVRDLFDPELNVRYGAWYLRHLLNRYGDERTALAAYHAGQGNVDRWRSDGRAIAFPETIAYVKKVQGLKEVYARTYGHELGIAAGAGGA
jgi:soluble lytic murein transglycosylase